MPILLRWQGPRDGEYEGNFRKGLTRIGLGLPATSRLCRCKLSLVNLYLLSYRNHALTSGTQHRVCGAVANPGVACILVSALVSVAQGHESAGKTRPAGRDVALL